MDVTIDGHDVKVQIGLNLTVVGSKDLPPDPNSPAAAPAPTAPSSTPTAPGGTNEKGEADF
jgi:hypothetical protein